GIVKSFGATKALRNATFAVRSGEVHTLVGENGSGKSTLVKILSGVHVPNDGSIELAGIPVAPFPTPRAAHVNGVSTVFQELLVADARSGLDNVWLGAEPLGHNIRSKHARRTEAAALLEELIGGPVDLGTSVGRLSLSDCQACVIVRAL